jgi:glycosyltransferase involved in cell wall biosynthesis
LPNEHGDIGLDVLTDHHPEPSERHRPPMRDPRVVMVVTDTDRRGAQVFATDLHDALAGDGLPVRTVALAPGASGGLPLPVLGPSRRSLSTLRHLRQEGRRHDVVVAHGSTTLPLSALATFASGVPFVYRQISHSLFWASTPLKRMRTAWAMRRAARVVALWQGAADVLVGHFGVDPGRLRVVPNGVPADRFPLVTPDDRERARATLGIEPDLPILAYAGALVPEKGVDVAIDAMAGIDGRLLVAGDGPHRSRLEAMAEQVAPGRVTFAGSLPDAALVYRAADLVVLPSRGGDSMPAVLIEAGLSGLPTVSTPVEGIPDIVDDGVTGVLVPPSSSSELRVAVTDLLDDPARRTTLGAAARQRCLERFDIAVVAHQWEQVLAEAVDI